MAKSIRCTSLGKLCIVAIAAAFSLTIAMSAASSAKPAVSRGVISVQADHAKIQRLPRSASTIILGNPLIADVTVEGGKLLVITGKNYGTTNLIALDQAGVEIAHFKIHVKTNGIHKLTVQSGVAKLSYTCAPRCEREYQAGDDPASLEALNKSIKNKATLSKNSNQTNNDE